MKIPTIETPRLYLRGFQKEDARFAAGIWNDAEMGEYLPDEAMEELDEEYLHQLEQLGEDEECCYLIAEDKQSGERIGTCSFLPKDGVYDLAYCVHKQFWGRGYATEMAKGMAEYARSSKAKAVTIWVTEGNNASVRVAQKLGCVQDGKSSYQKRGTDKTYTDLSVFSAILRKSCRKNCRIKERGETDERQRVSGTHTGALCKGAGC